MNVDEYLGMHVSLNDDSNNIDDYYDYVVNACVNDAPVLASTIDSDLK